MEAERLLFSNPHAARSSVLISTTYHEFVVLISANGACVSELQHGTEALELKFSVVVTIHEWYVSAGVHLTSYGFM
jgi:hypothetical protein